MRSQGYRVRFSSHKVDSGSLAWLCSLLISALLISGCGGGSPIQSPMAPLNPNAVSIPFSDVGVPVALPAVNGYRVIVTIPSNSLSATANAFMVNVTHNPPGGTPQLYVTLTSPVAARFSGFPKLKIAVPKCTAVDGCYYRIAIYDPAHPGWRNVTDWIAASDSAVDFSAFAVPFDIVANREYGLALLRTSG
jgi:hypothetical protein